MTLPPEHAPIVVGVLALQGAFVEHIKLLQQAAASILSTWPASSTFPDRRPPTLSGLQSNNTPAGGLTTQFAFLEVRTPQQLSTCSALIIPGGESTAISLIAERTGLLDPLRDFVKIQRKPVWGTCAGLILLAESANKSKQTGQELIGGLDVRVQRNYFGRQVESFEADLELPFLNAPFHSVFIRAPVVEQVLPSVKAVDAEANAETVLAPPRQATTEIVEVLGRLPGRAKAIRDKITTAEDLGEDGDIVAVKQGNVFGTAFHPELTDDERIHVWWLTEVMRVTNETKPS